MEDSLPAEDETDDVLWATVTTQSGGLNMRVLPQTGSLILTTLPRNAEVIVTGRGDAWSSVRYNGLNGYVMTRYLTFAGEEDTPSEPFDSDTATVVTPGGTLNLRFAPQTGSEILFTIPQGAQVTVHSYAVDWCHVTYLGISGYVMTTFLSFENSNGNASVPEMNPETVSRAVVNTVSGSLNLRLEPSAMAAVIAWIPQYARVDVLEYGEQWCLISWQGKTGYVMTSFLRFETDEPQQPEADDTPSQTVGQTAYVLRFAESAERAFGCCSNSVCAPAFGSCKRVGLRRYMVCRKLWHGNGLCDDPLSELYKATGTRKTG